MPDLTCLLRSSYLPVCLTVLFLNGCGPAEIKAGREEGELTGTITLNDKPLTSGVICLNDEDDGDAALGTIGPDGKFTVLYKLSPKIPSGRYKVTVAPAPPATSPSPEELMKNPGKYQAPNPIPEKYRTPVTTDLTVEVLEGQNTVDLKLKS